MILEFENLNLRSELIIPHFELISPVTMSGTMTLLYKGINVDRDLIAGSHLYSCNDTLGLHCVTAYLGARSPLD
jgi:hypothetical protein